MRSTAQKLFSALSSPQRLGIIHLILESDRPIHVKGISRELRMDYAVTHRHVERLKECGILSVHEVGRSRVPYVADRAKLQALLAAADDLCMSSTT
ncbi:MAG: winged helix-turn-helix transcriptional regulator [Nitrososphaerota archaeon]|nr:winged helix-turn-helix transcriptional regulator [Nitrososphaerota archaeon]MDG6939828.1 winged helix-turn-helix transcriptional regulator [Nitrososphaerota archaeon]